MKIGQRRLTPTRAKILDTTIQVQEQATKRNVEQAKIQNTVTLGRQTFRTRDIEKKLRKIASSTTRQTRETQAEPPNSSAKDAKENFLTTFAEELSPQETQSIMTAASSSIAELKNHGQSPDGAVVMAAHTYNFSKKSLQENLPDGTTLKEARNLANSHPEIAGRLALLDSASTYMKRIKKNQPTEDVGAQPKKPVGLSSEALAKIQADSIQTMLEVSKGWQQVLSQYRKSAAERCQLAADTSQEISDIYMRLHQSRARAHSQHAKQYVYLLTEVWPKA